MTCYYNEWEPFAAQWLSNLGEAGHIPHGTVDTRSITEVDAEELRGYTQCHFFAGIGGWPEALRLAGWPTDREVWTGSCPCQPFSNAGKRKGAADERHLWPEFFRLIRECRPATVFGEQVASKAGREWLSGVFADLESVGYAVAGTDLCAAGVGAPHIRQRLWWVADADPAGQREQRRPEPGGRGLVGGCSAGGMGDASGARLAQRVGDRRVQPQTMVAPPWETSERASWISCADGKARRIEPGLEPLAHGVSSRVGRLRAYGNAIVPQVAAEFVKAFMEVKYAAL